MSYSVEYFVNYIIQLASVKMWGMAHGRMEKDSNSKFLTFKLFLAGELIV